MTTKKRRQRQVQWTQSIHEGRVVRFPQADTLREYPTREQARAAVWEAQRKGMKGVGVVKANGSEYTA